ncbi:sulfur carrier protein ThiS [Paludibacterium purpuratum]|uniref:Sulfur carrier protein ThiS n=2 Tax=Paludibacterium purpuratum TaxID=1144873 RepID=A0A4R7BCA7_9NEIS|nr:sulfur carrier protein ThiS [Paludibacterium purpuratum]
MLQLMINGEAKRFESVATVAELIQALSLGDKRVAVERNGEIVPKSRHRETLLVDHDVLEIVVAVGGG